MPLTSQEQEQYFLTEGKKANPLSPAQYEAQLRRTTGMPGVLTSDLLAGGQQEMSIPSVPVDNYNYMGTILGGQALANALKAPATPDLTSMISDISGQVGLDEKTAIASESRKQQELLQAQMAALTAEAQAVPIQIQQEFTGRGVTAGGVQPIETARLRDIALRSLPLQGQILAQQAIATADQRALEAAQSKFNTIFQIQVQQAQMDYDAKREQRKMVWDYLTKAEQRQLDAIQKQDDREFQLKMNTIQQQHQVDLLKMRQDFETAQQVQQTQLAPEPKPLSPSTALQVADSQAALDMLNNLEGTIEANKGSFGPFVGRVLGVTPYATKTQTVQATINATKQIVGKYLEGGVLRKEDEAKYEKILPKLSDTLEVALSKLKSVRRLVTAKIEAQNAELQEQGYLVSGGGFSTLGTTSSGLNYTIEY